MKIKMLTGAVGADFVLNRGEVTDRYEIPEARRLVEAGLAEFVVDPEGDELGKLRAELMMLRNRHAATVAALAAATKPAQGDGA
ncbi:hypothetical protein GOZ78_03250 [Agrobacterium vitis]|uniref:Uncharacterized protein n=1 Tax=Agrobacterium vitis TaxID=373 RepID=A0AAE5B4G6_AGRVI|nr:hypothetical protein [Agrobacterium vitis]MCF1502016.1 hypothetical protein [Allorhizobium sp. Av2]MCM2443480.1 hypothetical protein [Agrobacterium vitis]MUO77915.1 hypothetical protein [Agrobacterium vitis]MUO93433.1 hypothetical protein [Agrobacterium vitis]MUP04784.1 hypothetical protein [Agrobacterium vitis]